MFYSPMKPLKVLVTQASRHGQPAGALSKAGCGAAPGLTHFKWGSSTRLGAESLQDTLEQATPMTRFLLARHDHPEKRQRSSAHAHLAAKPSVSEPPVPLE